MDFQDNKEKYSPWVYAIIVLVIVLSFFFNEFFYSIVGLVFSFLFAYLCSGWASKINKSRNWAFIIGFVFGIFGLLAYYLYYISKLDKSQKIKKPTNWKKIAIIFIVLFVIETSLFIWLFYGGSNETYYELSENENICYTGICGDYDDAYYDELEGVCYCYSIAYQEDMGAQETITTPPDDADQCNANLFNCDDFSSQGEAQAVFLECGGVSNDVHHLDGDEDGIACESLP